MVQSRLCEPKEHVQEKIHHHDQCYTGNEVISLAMSKQMKREQTHEFFLTFAYFHWIHTLMKRRRKLSRVVLIGYHSVRYI